MDYWRLELLEATPRRRAIRNLKRLRGFLDGAIPRRTAEGRLVLGAWNLRNFDDNRFGKPIGRTGVT